LTASRVTLALSGETPKEVLKASHITLANLALNWIMFFGVTFVQLAFRWEYYGMLSFHADPKFVNTLQSVAAKEPKKSTIIERIYRMFYCKSYFNFAKFASFADVTTRFL
jgi:hypothetical protein